MNDKEIEWFKELINKILRDKSYKEKITIIDFPIQTGKGSRIYNWYIENVLRNIIKTKNTSNGKRKIDASKLTLWED